MKGSTMLSQIVWVMFLAHNCLPKVAKNCQKKPRVHLFVNQYMGSNDSGSDDTTEFKDSFLYNQNRPELFPLDLGQ